MADDERLWVFAYDVSDRRRRGRVARELESRMVRVQKSVFEARMTRATARALAQAAARHLGPEDSLRIYGLGAHSQRYCEAFGGVALPEQGDFYLF